MIVSEEQAYFRVRPISMISVIIPVHNDEKNLDKCLTGLAANDYDDYEVIVIDDCSTDGSAQIAARHKCKVATMTQRSGPAAARREGLKQAAGEIVAFLDSDCQPPSDWLKKIKCYLKKEMGGVGGIYVYEDNGSYLSLFLKYFSQYWFGRWPRRETDFLLGGNCAYWTAVLREDRRCDEQVYFKGISSGDDTLMNLEISRNHILAFFPELKVTHSHFGFAAFLKKQLSWGFSRTVISFLYTREKLWRAEDLPLVQLAVQLLAAAVLLISLFTLKWHLILPALVFILLAHLNNLTYLYRKTDKVLFIPYAFLVLLSRDLAYLLGIVKGVVFLIGRRITHWIDNIRIALNCLNPFTPSKLHFFITSRCNARCDYCFLNVSPDTQADLSTEEIEKMVEKLGVLPYVVITGGEPFLRDDVALICKLFYERCLSRFFVIATNGFFTEKIAAQIKEVLRDCAHAYVTVQVSVDGIDFDHDRAKRLGGSFQKAVATLERLQGLKRYFRNLNVNISTLVTEENSKKLDEIAAYFIRHHKIDNHFVTLKHCPPKTVEIKHIAGKDYFTILKTVSEQHKKNGRTLFGRFYSSLYAAVICEMKRFLERRGYLRPCLAARKFLVLDEKAQFCLCELRKEKIGNLMYAKSLKDLLRSKEARTLRGRVRKERCFCNWGCAITANFIFSASVWPEMAKIFIKELLAKKTEE